MPPSLSSKSPERLRAERAGRRAEAWAALFLRINLYSVREKRFKTPVGEIDLIAERFGTLVFVEVKARASRDSEADALAAVKQRRILRAAQYYLVRNPRLADRRMRFDVIFLAPLSWPRHLKNAFSA